MDKYTKSLIFVLKIPVGIICILAGLALISISFWVSTFSDVASLLFVIAFLGGGGIINFGVGYAFLGDEYKATRIVRDGDTRFTPVKSTKFLKRRKLVTFIGVIAYLVLTLYYIVRAILVGVYRDYLEQTGFNSSIIALVCYAIISLVVAFCLFMLYKRTKHIDLGEKQS